MRWTLLAQHFVARQRSRACLQPFLQTCLRVLQELGVGKLQSIAALLVAERIAELKQNGYPAYTTSAGPRWVPPKRDDVTIGVLPRLTSAIDKAAVNGSRPGGGEREFQIDPALPPLGLERLRDFRRRAVETELARLAKFARAGHQEVKHG